MQDDKRSLIGAIAPELQPKRGWKVVIDGQPLTEVSLIEIESKYGTLRYGAVPGGAYDQWAFRELGGGGSVILPYALIERDLYIGVVEQNRPFQGGKVLNVPRGFLEPGGKHFDAAHSEFVEEVGYARPFDVIPLPGAPANPNSTFFETWGSDEGVKFYAVSIPSACIEVSGEPSRYRFKTDVVKADPGSKAVKLAEQILGAKFIPWTDALKLGDMFSVAGAGRLLGFLSRSRMP